MESFFACFCFWLKSIFVPSVNWPWCSHIGVLKESETLDTRSRCNNRVHICSISPPEFSCLVIEFYGKKCLPLVMCEIKYLARSYDICLKRLF